MVDLIIILVSGFFISFILTTLLIRLGIPKLDKDKGGEALPESSDKGALFDFRSTGFWIGFCETLLIFAFVYAGKYEALAIIIGTKGIVRKDDIHDNPSYYLLGNLINISVAFVIAVIAQALIR